MFVKYKKVSQLNKNQYFGWDQIKLGKHVYGIFDFISRKRETWFNAEKSK